MRHLFYKNLHILILTLLLLFHLTSNIIWIKLDNAPLEFDPSTHALSSIQYKECLENIIDNGLIRCLRLTPFYPPGMYLIGGVLMGIFGVSIELTQLIGTIFFLMLIISVYLWVNMFFEDKTTALLTSIIVSFTAGIYELSRFLWQETPVLAISFFTMYFLLKTNNFSNKKYTYFAFFLLGFGMLTKWITAIYLLVPFFITTLYAIKQNGLKDTFRTALLGLTITSVVFGPWLIANLKPFLYFSSFWSRAEPAEPQHLVSMENLMFYPNWIVKFNYGAILSLVSFIGTIVFLLTTTLNKKFYVLGVIFVPYIFFNILGNKDPRYTLFLLPVLIACTIYGLKDLFKKRVLVFWCIILLIIGYQSLQYFKFSYDLPKNLDYRISIQVPLFDYVDVINLSSQYYPARVYDNKSNWPITKIIDDVNNLSAGENVKFQTIVEYPKLNNRNLQLEAKVKDYKGIEVNDDLPFGYINGFESEEKVVEYILSKDYFLISSHEPSTYTYTFKPTLNQIQTVFYRQDVSVFAELVGTYKLPYEEINNLLYEQNDEKSGGIRYETCKEIKCDEVYLYKIKKNIEIRLNNGELQQENHLISIANNVPTQCGAGLCELSIVIPSKGWARIKGTTLGYLNELWEYDASKDQGNVWVFKNNSDRQLEVKLLGWAKGNGVNVYKATENENIDTLAIESLKTGIQEIQQRGNCSGNGCKVIGYTIWECNLFGCELNYRNNPVGGGDQKLISSF